jgi:hypothetical protein
MKIQAGYEISYNCSQPTPMILMLSVHPSRITDLITPDRLRLDPAIPANSYRDGFGNTCHVIHAPTATMMGRRTHDQQQSRDEISAGGLRRTLRALSPRNTWLIQ